MRERLGPCLTVERLPTPVDPTGHRESLAQTTRLFLFRVAGGEKSEAPGGYKVRRRWRTTGAISVPAGTTKPGFRARPIAFSIAAVIFLPRRAKPSARIVSSRKLFLGSEQSVGLDPTDDFDKFVVRVVVDPVSVRRDRTRFCASVGRCGRNRYFRRGYDELTVIIVDRDHCLLVGGDGPGDLLFAVEEPVLTPDAVEAPSEPLEVLLPQAITVAGRRRGVVGRAVALDREHELGRAGVGCLAA